MILLWQHKRYKRPYCC